HRQQASHFLAADRGLIEYAHAQARVALRERTRLLCEVDGSADVAREIGEIALHDLRGGHRFPVRETALGGCGPAHGPYEHFLQCRRWWLARSLEIVDAIERAARELRHGTPEIVIVELLDLRAVERDGTARDAGTGERTRSGRPRLAPAPALQLLGGAHAGEQYMRGGDAGEVGHQQWVAGATGEIAAHEELAQPPAACGIHTAALCAELRVLEHAK